MKLTKRTLQIIAPVAGVAALVAAAAILSGPAKDLLGAGTSASVAEDGAFRFRFPAGDVYTYDFRLETEQLLAAPRKGGKPIGGSLTLAGELRLRSYGQHEGNYRLGVSLPRLDEHALSFQGRDVLGDAEAERTFGEREAFIEVTDRGKIAAMWFAKDAPPTFRSVMESVIPSIVVRAPETNDLMWSAEEQTPLGKARTFYVATEDAPLTARRNRADYLGLKAFAMAPAPGDPDLQSDGSVTLAKEGHVKSVRGHEKLSVREEGKEDPRFSATISVELEKKHVTKFKPGALALHASRFERVRPGTVMTSEQVRKKMWQEMVGSMTLTDVERGISTYAVKGISPQDGWLTRAVLLLKMNPVYATRLADMFQKPGMSSNGRAFICDLLSSAGTPEAQAALRDALGSDAALSDPERYPAMLQRFSFVMKPTPETTTFLETQMAAGKGVDRLAAAHSLGAAARPVQSVPAVDSRVDWSRLVYMTKVVGAYEAKTHFSKLLERVERGEVIQITRHGKLVAEIRPITATRPVPKPGLFKGKIRLSDDFDEPLEDMAEYMK